MRKNPSKNRQKKITALIISAVIHFARKQVTDQGNGFDVKSLSDIAKESDVDIADLKHPERLCRDVDRYMESYEKIIKKLPSFNIKQNTKNKRWNRNSFEQENNHRIKQETAMIFGGYFSLLLFVQEFSIQEFSIVKEKIL